jgi:hypothetical protein
MERKDIVLIRSCMYMYIAVSLKTFSDLCINIT